MTVILFVSVKASDAYVNILSIVVFFSLNLNFFDMFLFKKKILAYYNRDSMVK